MSMSTDRTLERALVAAMTDDVGQPPEPLLNEILARTEAVRPLPTVIALVAAPPMVLPARVAVGVRRSRLLFAAAALFLLGAALLAGALLRTPTPAPDGWLGWGGGPGRTGAATSGPTGEPRLRWTFQAVGAIDATPVIAGDLVVVASRDGLLHGIQLANGAERWSAPIGAGIGAPATDGTRVFVEDGGGSVHAIRLSDGAPVWTNVALGDGGVDLAVADGNLYATTTDGAITALDATDGSGRWRESLGSPDVRAAGVALAGDVVLVTTIDSRLVALRRDDGSKAWSVQLDPVTPGMPVAADGLAWTGPADGLRAGTLRAVRIADGTPAWAVADSLYAPAVREDLAISASADGVVRAVDAATGAERWRRVAGGTLSQVAIAGDTAFLLSTTDRQVYGLDTASGVTRWQLALDALPGCCVAVADGVLAVGTTSGRLTVFETGPSSPAEAESTPAAGTSARPAPATPISSDAAVSATPLAGVPLTVTQRLDPAAFGIGVPLGVAVTDAGELFVTDTTHHLTRIGADGALVAQWGGKGTAEGRFDFGAEGGGTSARGPVAIGPDGLVYVSDADNHRVQVFTQDGAHVRTLGSLGSASGQFTIPFDLTVDDDGDVYVLDDGAERITKLRADGTPLWVADHRTDSRLTGHPHTPSLDSAGRLVVSIDDTQTIVRLDPETGRVIDTLSGGGCDAPIDQWDRLYVLDCYGGLTVVDDAGRALATDRSLDLQSLRLGPDGRGVGIGRDGGLLVVQVTPPRQP